MAENKNISSGAEKAEKLALANKKNEKKDSKKDKTKKPVKSVKTNETKPESKKSSTKKGKNTTKSEKPVKGKKGKNTTKSKGEARKLRHKKHEERAAKRAQIVADRKQKKQERRLEHKERKSQRRAAFKEKREERKQNAVKYKQERRAHRQTLKSEDKEARRARIAEERKAKREAAAAKREAYLADKKAKREHAAKVRAEKRAQRYQQENKRNSGFGGWLAAVISLGVTTLALGTVVTFGALTMNNMQADMAMGYTRSLYELNAVVDNLDANLARAQVSSSASDRVRVFSDIAIESETAETILERLPLDMQFTESISSFVNKMSDSAKDMLYTVANGGELSSSQRESLEYMYQSNKKLKAELNALAYECDGKDMLCAMRGKPSMLGDGFTVIQNNTFEVPKGIHDGPFSDSVKKTNPLALKGLEEITAQRAEKLAEQYFKGYKIKDAHCTGEVAATALTLYNVDLETEDGAMSVQISKLGGKVVSFDSFKDCSDKKFSVDRCIAIAEDFLSDIGYGHLQAVWASENGTTCNLNFAPVQGGVILYPDLVKVKVCEERGIVTGIEALSYVLNHGERDLPSAAVTADEAQGSISGDVEVTSTNRALIPLNGEEVLCYEFVGTAGGNRYYVYVDAVTGEEVEVLTVVGTKQGKSLM